MSGSGSPPLPVLSAIRWWFRLSLVAATWCGCGGSYVRQTVATPAPRGPLQVAPPLSPGAIGLEMGGSVSPRHGTSDDAGHLVATALFRGRASLRASDIEAGLSIEIGPLALTTPVNNDVATDGFATEALVLLGFQTRWTAWKQDWARFGVLAEWELAILPYMDVFVDTGSTARDVQLDAMFRAGPWVALSPWEPLWWTAGLAMGLHPWFEPDYTTSADVIEADARRQTGSIMLFTGLSARLGGHVTVAGQFTWQAIGAAPWQATHQIGLDITLRMEWPEVIEQDPEQQRLRRAARPPRPASPVPAVRRWHIEDLAPEPPR